jgi:hypothetical protein
MTEARGHGEFLELLKGYESGGDRRGNRCLRRLNTENIEARGHGEFLDLLKGYESGAKIGILIQNDARYSRK